MPQEAPIQVRLHKKGGDESNHNWYHRWINSPECKAMFGNPNNWWNVLVTKYRGKGDIEIEEEMFEHRHDNEQD